MVELAVGFAIGFALVWKRERIYRATVVLGCWMTGHRGLGSICHNCGVHFTRKGL